ncbi:MAG: TetR/AcrR family transcriptional regulator [Actinomycetota bacterium]|nr:TetR/AcrR family transcriptional regulator [Actinomycetota bacterium]
MTAGGRRYGGRTESERRADRRERLLASALQLFGTEGWSATSVERLCAESGVATRYFYEEFVDREDILRAVYLSIQHGATEAVIEALLDVPPDLPSLARTGVGRYVRYHAEDPRRARVVHCEARVAGTLERERHKAMLGFADLIEHAVRNEMPSRSPQRQRVLALALAGGVSEVLVDWVASDEPRPPTEPIIDELTAIYLAALGYAGPDDRD